MNIDIAGTLDRIPQMDDPALGRLMTNVAAWLASGDAARITAAEQVAEAVQTERAQRAAAGAAQRQALVDAPPCRRVRAAFDAVPPTETDIKVLSVLLHNPGRTSADLSAVLGWDGQIWHTHFGLLCSTREAWLWPAEPARNRDRKFWCGILADHDDTDATWRVKPDLAPTLAQIAGVRA